MSEGDIIVRAAFVSFEWLCQSCGDSGAGMMPEDHASGACEATRTVQRQPYRMNQEIARTSQDMVSMLLDGALYMDGGGI